MISAQAAKTRRLLFVGLTDRNFMGFSLKASLAIPRRLTWRELGRRYLYTRITRELKIQEFPASEWRNVAVSARLYRGW